jgi:peptidyl-dipeptidase A
VSKALVAQKYDAVKMTKLAESFFVSLGLPKLPDTFWERSMLVQPEGKEVQCHASAWDPTYAGDVRIKMCTKVNQEDLITLHHELGHDYYYLHYYKLPVLFQTGANDGFHEAIGDTIALSITPSYLKQVGLLDKVAVSPEAVINQQMFVALDKIAFLPFGLVVDKWRWEAFSGKITPAQWNDRWWELRKQYQGVMPPVARAATDFDPGAKYHVPGSTPYLRYFLARIYQFQFHRALGRAAGHKGSLETCSIFGNKEAGAKLRAMLALGASKPWPEALAVLSGETRADATAMLEYFKPLAAFLDEQNKGETCGF